MALRLVRQSSNTPNISNRDDACMARYAYGGFNGVVKNFGQELSLTAGNGSVTLNSGRAVIQGWEIDIESETLSIPASTGTEYIHVYIELNLLLEEAQLKTVSSGLNTAFPLSLGDDLTQNTSGTARLPLHRFALVASSIQGIVRESEGQLIDYTKDIETYLYNKFSKDNSDTNKKFDSAVSTINQRLDKLGFRSGAITFLGSTYGSSGNTDTASSGVFRQGNYVIVNMVTQVSITQNILTAYLGSGGNPLFVLPENFRPKAAQRIFLCIFYGTNDYYLASVEIGTNGEAKPLAIAHNLTLPGSQAKQCTVNLRLGFEANPIA